MEEQILLCTLLPFRGHENLPQGPLVESQSPIQIVWRTNEIRFTDPESRTTTMALDNFLESSWTHLLGLTFCKLNTLFNSFKTPVAIRLYLVKDLILESFELTALCSANFMAFEFSLSECLRQGYFTIENKSQKKKAFDLNPKAIDLSTCAWISQKDSPGGLHWCFLDLCFKSSEARQPRQFLLRPTFLVANITNHWRELFMDHLTKISDNLLIITRNPELWPKECVLISNNGLEINHNENISGSRERTVYIATPKIVTRNFEKRLELLDLVGSLASNIYVNRKSHQVHRLLVNNLARKFMSFKLPLDFHTFGAIVLDDFSNLDAIDLMPKTMTRRWINIAHDNANTRPQQLSYRQLQYSLKGEPVAYLPLLSGRYESFLFTLPVPKQVLRRYRIFGHLVRNAPVEDRIQKLFPNGCPLDAEDAIQRFSGKPMPSKLASAFINRHFEHLGSSLGEYSLPVGSPITPISVPFVVESMKKTPRECSICFETLSSAFRFSICGHIYCKDCTSVFFKPEWSQGKTKECAVCRLHLLTADVFAIEAFEDDFVLQLGSKAQSIQNFLGSTKSRCSFWPLEGGTCDAKVVIVKDIKQCSPDMIVKHAGPLNIHVFYTPDETVEFMRMQNNFL